MEDVNLNAKLVDILWGLPASGKTTYAHDKYAVKHGETNSAKIIDCDEVFLANLHQWNTFLQEVINQCKATLDKPEVDRIVIDGLFTTNEKTLQLIEALRQYDKTLNFRVICFTENRDQCLINDWHRCKVQKTRDKMARQTILKIPFEAPDNKILKVDRIINVACAKTLLPFELWLKRHKITENQFNEESIPVYITYAYNKSNVLASFSKFSDLLEERYCTMTLSQYRQIIENCCSVQIDFEEDYSDYYGDYTCSYTRLVDLQKAFELLVKFGLTNVENLIKGMELTNE